MGSIDNIVLRIIEGRKAGLSNEELSRKLGCSVDFLADYGNLLKEVSRLQLRLKRAGLSLDAQKSVSKHYGIPIILGLTTKELRIELIREIVYSGVESVEEIADRIGLAEYTVRSYASDGGINLPKKKRGRKPKGTTIKPEINSLIERGLTLQEIANLQNPRVTREAVRQYLVRTGQHERWRERRKELNVLDIREEYASLATCLVSIAIQKSREEGDLAYGKALEYHYSRKGGCRYRKDAILVDQLYELFKWYYAAQEEGTKLSITELSESSGIHQNNIGRILRSVGLDVMYRPMGKVKEKVRTSEWKKEAIDRCFGLEINTTDIEYLLNVPWWVVSQRFSNIGKREVNYPSIKGQGGFGKLFRYKDASQVYEALDLGFSVGETSELLDISEGLVNYYERNRGNIETRIIEALDIMYPKLEHDKPYL